jgi:ppGpp synthetase/RelA/SpoT-type nucleotidyltranferase
LSGDFSVSQTNRLGDRLRKDKPLPADIETLDAFRRSFDNAQQIVVQRLRDLGLEQSVRIKTTISIVEKLKRESIRLSKLQDIAGCRVVVGDIGEQDRIVELTSGVFPRATVMDRRQRPSHGYCAVHLIIDIDRRLVEVQIRTELQHLWAVYSETWADALDQSIKYGGGPPEIQENLRLKSEIVALIESGQQRLMADLNTQNSAQQMIQVGQLHKLLSTGQLTAGAMEAAGLVRDFTDLIRREQEMKERFTRDILKLESERRNT